MHMILNVIWQKIIKIRPCSLELECAKFSTIFFVTQHIIVRETVTIRKIQNIIGLLIIIIIITQNV